MLCSFEEQPMYHQLCSTATCPQLLLSSHTWWQLDRGVQPSCPPSRVVTAAERFNRSASLQAVAAAAVHACTYGDWRQWVNVPGRRSPGLCLPKQLMQNGTTVLGCRFGCRGQHNYPQGKRGRAGLNPSSFNAHDMTNAAPSQ